MGNVQNVVRNNAVKSNKFFKVLARSQCVSLRQSLCLAIQFCFWPPGWSPFPTEIRVTQRQNQARLEYLVVAFPKR